MTPIPTITFRDGTTIPRLGMGSWLMGDHNNDHAREVRSLRQALDDGLRLIDTAEMYGHGRSERIVGNAIRGRRSDAFLVSKVLPYNAGYTDTIEACKRSLHHLGTDYLDLYLLHWRSHVPLSETIRAFDTLKKEGLIKGWGVSNFDVDDMEELEQYSQDAMVNQILYSLLYRGTEFDLQKRDAQNHIVTMAYCPLGQGGELLKHPTLTHIAHRHRTPLGPATPAQIALAWVLRNPHIIPIPKAATPEHQRDNIAALHLSLTPEDLLELDRAFPPPQKKVPLAVI